MEEIHALSREAATFEEMLAHLRSWHHRRDENLASWLALRTELWLYGLRDPELLPVLADRERRSRDAIAQSLEQGFAARGVTTPAPVELLALIVHALDDGLSIQRVLFPSDRGTDSVVDVVELLMKSWTALARSTATAAGPTAAPAPQPPTENLEKNP